MPFGLRSMSGQVRRKPDSASITLLLPRVMRRTPRRAPPRRGRRPAWPAMRPRRPRRSASSEPKCRASAEPSLRPHRECPAQTEIAATWCPATARRSPHAGCCADFSPMCSSAASVRQSSAVEIRGCLHQVALDQLRRRASVTQPLDVHRASRREMTQGFLSLRRDSAVAPVQRATAWSFDLLHRRTRTPGNASAA